MPIQGSGAISISDLVGEFAGQAPHSLTEYYRNGSLVDSTRNVTGSATKSDGGTTTDFAGVTGLSVSRTTGTVNATNMTLSGSSVTVPAGAYVDFTIRRRGGRNSSTAISRGNIAQGPDANPVYNSGWLIYETTLNVSGGSGSGLEARSQHSVYSGPYIQTSHTYYHGRMSSSNEAAYGVPVRYINNTKVFWPGSQAIEQGDFAMDPTELFDNGPANLTKNSPYVNLPTSNTARTKHWGYMTGEPAGTPYRLLRVDVSLRIRGYNNSGSSKTLTFGGTTTMSGQSIGGSTTNSHTPVNSLSITANSGGTQTVYTYAVTNNTGSSGTVTVGGVDTVIANGATTNVSTNNSSSSLAISFQSTVTLNSSVPTSGAISLTDFYGAEEQ